MDQSVDPEAGLYMSLYNPPCVKGVAPLNVDAIFEGDMDFVGDG